MIGAVILLAMAGVSAEQKTLDQLSLKCGLSAGDVTPSKAGDFVRIIPKKQTATTADQVLCLLPKLKKAGFTTKVGFISGPTSTGFIGEPAAPEKKK